MARDAQLALLCLTAAGPPLVAVFALISQASVLAFLAVATAVAYLGYRWTTYLIPLLAPRHVKAGLVGKDINKRGTIQGDVPVPESLGLAPGVVCLVCLALIHLLHSLQAVPRLAALLGVRAGLSCEPDPWIDDFPAALASIAFMLMLGFVDDVLDLPWRVKLIMPIVASMPLLAAYSGGTAVGIPKFLVHTLSLPYTYVELGVIYYMYMAMLVIFCTNSINILAGVNGLEAGQTLLVSAAILTHNVLLLARTGGALLQARQPHTLFPSPTHVLVTQVTLGNPGNAAASAPRLCPYSHQHVHRNAYACSRIFDCPFRHPRTQPSPRANPQAALSLIDPHIYLPLPAYCHCWREELGTPQFVRHPQQWPATFVATFHRCTAACT
jgi:UDP-N-acetylglucosamine--dolichyl-phosphate N-acetylglucosaminephosphotransferase